MCMRSIDNTVDIMPRVPSRTRTDALLIGDGLRTRMPYATRSFLVLTGVHGNAQETLTREKGHRESRRKPMFPHFFIPENGSFRTWAAGTGSGSELWKSLWITCLRSWRRGESSREVERRRSMSIPGTKWSPTCTNLARMHQELLEASSNWLWREGTCRGLTGVAISRSAGAGSTSASVPATPKVTAKTARVSYESGPHTMTHTFVGRESLLEAELHGKGRGCL